MMMMIMIHSKFVLESSQNRTEEAYDLFHVEEIVLGGKCDRIQSNKHNNGT